MRDRQLRPQGGPQRGRDARVALAVGQRFVGHELGLHNHPNFPIERLDLVQNRGDSAMSERHQTGRGNANRSPGWRRPLHVSAEDPRAEIQHPFVATELAVPNVKRLILDQQANDLAVGRIDHGLSRLRVAVPALGIRQWPDLIETRQVGPQQPVWLALVEIPPQPDMPVREREHRLGLREPLEVKLDLAQRPRVDQKRRMLDHALRSPTGSVLAMCAPLKRIAPMSRCKTRPF